MPGSRNCRCKRMYFSNGAMNAAAMPLLQQGLVKFGREVNLVWRVNCIASLHSQTVNFLLFLLFPLSADSVLIKRLVELY